MMCGREKEPLNHVQQPIEKSLWLAHIARLYNVLQDDG
jgi:hypothetical protein